MSELDSYWYCPNCQEELNGNRVTYQELCDTCGHEVIWIKNQSTTELEELLKAKAEGRLKIFPCKVGDTVYTTLRGKVEPITVHGWRWSQHDAGWVLLVSRMIKMEHDCVPHCLLDSFGKAVFLTKAEAEKALKEIKHD